MRGTNENSNGLTRQYFPKGTDLCRYSEDEIDAVAPTHSTADPARLSTGPPQPKPSTGYSRAVRAAVLPRPLEPTQCTAIRFTEHLALEGGRPSIGSVGDAFDNALMECVIGLYKTECIRTTVFHTGPYRTTADVEYATAGWIDWYNNRRLHRASATSARTSGRQPTTRPSPESRNPYESGTKPRAFHVGKQCAGFRDRGRPRH